MIGFFGVLRSTRVYAYGLFMFKKSYPNLHTAKNHPMANISRYLKGLEFLTICCIGKSDHNFSTSSQDF